MSKSRKRSRVPGTLEQARYSARQKRYGVHFNALADMKGWKLTEGERVVAALGVRNRGGDDAR